MDELKFCECALPQPGNSYVTNIERVTILSTRRGYGDSVGDKEMCYTLCEECGDAITGTRGTAPVYK